ncbi:MAG: hypothetical protein HYX39_08565 [Bacteroidetes bacterium]|nr:hypothetical protein [Bacteroidota bacterium]
MVLAGTSANNMNVVKSQEQKIANVKYETHSEKPETVKYVSQTLNVKSASPLGQNEKAIEELFDRLIASIEGRFNKALEKAKQEMNEKYESFVNSNHTKTKEPGLCNEEAFNGVAKVVNPPVPKVNYCKPCNTLAVKYGSESNEPKNQISLETNFTHHSSVENNEGSEIVFPQMNPALSAVEKVEVMDVETQKEQAHQLRSLPLMDEEEDADEEDLAELERNEALLDDEEDQDEYEDLEEEEDSDQEEEYRTAENLRIAELEKQLEELKISKEKPVTPVIKEQEAEYKYIQSRIIRKIENEYEKINREYLHHDIYRGLDIEQKYGVNWLNSRLCCLLESMIKLSNYTEIDNHTLLCLTDAFAKLIKSESYKILPENIYQYKGLINELYVKLHNNLNKNRNNPFFAFKLPLDLKSRLIAVRRELKKVAEPMKFTEIDFSEKIALPQLREIHQEKNGAPGWQDRYRQMKREIERYAAQIINIEIKQT